MEQYKNVIRLWQSWRVHSTADVDLRLDSFRILFAYHSGKIENPEVSYYDIREIFEIGKVIHYTGSPPHGHIQKHKILSEMLQTKARKICAKNKLSQ